MFVLVFLAYLPIVPGAFLMDDQRLIHLENPLVNGQLTPLSIWFQTDFPLSNLAFLLEWRAWGMQPAFYHLVNLALHTFSAILVWRVLAHLKIRGAWLAAMLFAIHPVCVNSVARIAEQKNTLSLPFFLLSILFYLRYETAVLYPEPKQELRSRKVGTLFYTLSVTTFILALLAKTSVVMLPVALLACAVWQRRKLSWRDIAHVTPHFLLALSFGLMSIWFQKYQAMALAGQTLPSVSFVEKSIIASKVFLFYFGKILMPMNLTLVYPRWNAGAISPVDFVPLAMICAFGALCWRFRRSWGWHAFFGVASFAILLFPALGFFNAQYLVKWQVSDHLQYLPLIAPISLIAAAITSFLKSKIHLMSAAVVLLALFVVTSQRARVFSIQESLMRDTLAKNPLASDAHNDLGVVLTKRNNLPEALAEFTAAVQTDPDNAAAQSNLGMVLVVQGNLGEAKSHFQLALKTKPFDPDTHAKLASVLQAQGQFRLARAHLQMALRFKPTVDTRLQLADLLYHGNEFAGAVAQFREVIRVQPGLPDTLNNLAWVLATCSDNQVRSGDEAVRCAERACQLTQFKQAGYLSTLAAAYAEAGRFSEAISTAQIAIRLQIAAGANESADLNAQLLAGYRAGRPFHEQRPMPIAVVP